MTFSIAGTEIIGANRNLTAYRETVKAVGTVTGPTTLNLNEANIFDVTLGGNVTFTFSNPPASGTAVSATVILRQDATGSRTATFTNAQYTDAVAPVLTTTANKVDVLSFFTVNGGTRYFGSFVMANLTA